MIFSDRLGVSSGEPDLLHRLTELEERVRQLEEFVDTAAGQQCRRYDALLGLLPKQAGTDPAW